MMSFRKMMMTTAALAALQAVPALAQHSDVEFEYANGMIEVEFGAEGRVFESEFPTTGIFEQFTDDPGFASEAAEGLGVNPFDNIDYNILGPLEYHDGSGFAAVPTGASILIEDNPNGGLTVDASTAGPISGTGLIGQADAGGDVHTHIDFTLQPNTLGAPEYGAYALLMELTTDATGIGNSDSFYVVFNFGLDEVTFEGAVEDFANKIPEPTTLVVAAMGGLVLLSRRRLQRRD